MVLAALCFADSNFIFNGGFSLGNVGFVSGHAYVRPATDSLFPEGVYTITANPVQPFVLNTVGIQSYFDHTTNRANGAFLAVNGCAQPDSLVWEQKIF